MAIRTIVFDLGRVLVDFSYGEAYSRMQVLSGLPQAEIHERLFAGTLARDFETGRVGSHEFVDEVNRRMGTALPRNEFAAVWSSIFHQEPLVPVELLKALHTERRLVLLSNTNPLHFATIRETYPHIQHFDGLVLSYQAGCLKPDPAIYQQAIGQAQCEASECLFFDDIAENVDAARAEGMQAEQFQGLARLRDDLARHGITV